MGRVPTCFGHKVLQKQADPSRSFFQALSTLGTLGAGFTLSVVVQSSKEANAAGFNPLTVTTWAAVSSMLFVLTVLVSQGCAQLFRFERRLIVRGIDNDDHTIKHCLAALSLLLEIQVLGAFFFLELVLTAHVPTVGWVGIGVTSMLALIALYLWVLQATRQSSTSRSVNFLAVDLGCPSVTKMTS